MLLVDRDRRILFELYATRWDAAASRWKADSGAVFLLDGNGRRPEGWTSADAAGLAILPGLVRYDEAFGPDPIRHAFRVTVAGDERPRLSRVAHREHEQQPERAADGGAAAPQGGQEHRLVPGVRPEDLPGDEDLRPDRGRQRQQHVHLGRLRHAVGQRRPEPRVREPHRLRLRGRRAGLEAAGRGLDGTHRLLHAHPVPAPGHAARGRALRGAGRSRRQRARRPGRPAAAGSRAARRRSR